MSRNISICVPKGGVGKTTTAVNLASSLAVAEKKTLLIDVDPFGASALALGFTPDRIKASLAEVFSFTHSIGAAIHRTDLKFLDFVPSNVDTVNMNDKFLKFSENRLVLKNALQGIEEYYEFIIIDCPPVLKGMSTAALVASHSILVPIKPGHFSLEAVDRLIEYFNWLREIANPDLRIEGILMTMYEKDSKVTKISERELKIKHGSYLLNTMIPNTNLLNEASFYGKPLCLYRVNSEGSLAYLNLANEIITNEKKESEGDSIDSMDFPKNFDFNTIEQKWRDFWEERKLYESKPNPSKPKYSVVIPPPNVTGILHTGHMLNNTIQDVYCRMKRLEGFEVCWVPGMDHAGIATQVMVEKDLAGQGKKKEDLGREKFVELVWQWKEKNGGTILKQLRKLGASVDWSKERFTLDEGLSLNVRKVFVDLYKKGLIYRGNRIVNWDPVSKTAVSDDEMYYVERTDKLYFVKYLLENSDEFITVATTRPETLFGDTAVAVNPQDQRYNSFKNKKVRLPILNKLIPVVEDDYVDPEFGTGALKITPAHDLNDFEVGQRHGLPIINVLTTDSKLNEHAEEFSGLTVDDARIKVVERLQREGLLLKIEDYTHNVAVSDRTKAVIEPFLSEQWFVSMKELAQPAIEAVNSGQIKFYPDRYVKVYNHWMINIRDWCISRQLWWGHQIPIWYHNTTGEIYCEIEPPADPENWVQDEDVLDTWFSSWLWPLSVFGWENNEKDNENEDLKYYYPTDFLSTGNEIIFLWVARMIMAGLEYMKEIPFKDVYFHSIVRDSKGQKMSKTLGNYSDPIELMNTYGTDALRFTIVYLAPLGNDVLFDDEKTLIGRNFITKIWNAGRMLYMNRETELTKQTSLENSTKRFDIVDLWVNTKLNSVIAEAKGYLEQYRLNDYTKTLYNFVWNDFCDWYLEMLKVKIQKDPSNALESIGNAISIYEEILKILHPVIPFVTEELWHLMKDGREEQSISFEKIPDSSESLIDSQPIKDFEKITSLINSIRNLRANNELQFGKKIIAVFKPFDESSKALLESMQSYIEKLCNLEIAANTFEIGNLLTANTVSEGFEVQVFFEGNELDGKQAEKMQKDLENLQQYVASISKKLANQNFVSKAAPEVVTKEKEKLAEAEEKLLKIKSIIGKN